MKILVVGGGGREHALAWKIARSPLVDAVFCAPGNAGIAAVAECVDIAAGDLAALRAFARDQRIDLTVVGPEEPLCNGIVDLFRESGLRIFGPTRAAAEIEGSKVFARNLCRRYKIPGPSFWSFDNPQAALGFLHNRGDLPIVVKASGLAAGKGVTVAPDSATAEAAIRDMMERRRFGRAADTVVLEERLEGAELSMIALTDGATICPLQPARDHKPLLDDDEGPNTGGMGAVSPVRPLGSRTIKQVEDQVLFPAVHAMNAEKRTFSGFLYAGLMLTDAGPRVLEFNCRLGDPETQPLLMRMQSDLVPYLVHTAEGTLDRLEAPQWDPRTAVCVVACSGGYPGDYEKGIPIQGLDAVPVGDDLAVFHGGTSRRRGDVVTAGGRVLAVTALGDTAEAARDKAYGALAGIEFEGRHYRTDIGLR